MWKCLLQVIRPRPILSKWDAICWKSYDVVSNWKCWKNPMFMIPCFQKAMLIVYFWVGILCRLGRGTYAFVEFMMGMLHFTIGERCIHISDPAKAVDGLYAPISTKCDQLLNFVKTRCWILIHVCFMKVIKYRVYSCMRLLLCWESSLLCMDLLMGLFCAYKAPNLFYVKI